MTENSEKKSKPETPEQQRQRIGLQLAAMTEVERRNGTAEGLIGLKVFNWLIDANIEVERLRGEVLRLNMQLGNKIKDLVRNGRR